MAPTATNTYVPPDLDVEDKKKYSDLKKSLIKPENVQKLKDSWKRLLVELDKECDRIKDAGASYIPSVDWNDVKDNGGKVPDDICVLVKERGVLMVRNVVDRQLCEQWKESMKSFVTNHPEVSGFPQPEVCNWFAYWTKGEIEARSHPEIMSLMTSMGNLFDIHDDTLPIDKTANVVYPDSFRIRYPGKSMSLNLHLDSGAIERWEDKLYRKVYEPIFEGEWEKYDPWDLDIRSFARTDLYSHLEERRTATSGFRALQGWLALSDAKSGEGTLRVLPNIKLVNAYSLLRPFFWRDDGEIDLETPKFPGAQVGCGQYFFSSEDHPHLRNLETVFSIPYVNTGDYVFWHCDVAHEVDEEHAGTHDSSAFYYAYCPLCPYNIDNMLATRSAFENARPPRDVLGSANCGAHEGEFEDCDADRNMILSDEGLRAMGFKEYELEGGLTEGQIKVREYANEAMRTGVIDEKMYDVKFK